MHQILVDCHMHTNNSPDSPSAPEVMCQAAVNAGVSVIALSDHCEMNMYYEKYNAVVRKSNADAIKMQKAYPSLKVLKGVEMGQPLQNIKAANEMLDTLDFDFVLASLHNPPSSCDYPLVKEKEENPNYVEAFLAKDYAYLKYTDETAIKILTDYFNDMYETVKWGRFDSLAHITYPIRYCTGEQNITVDFDKLTPVIADIFHEIIKRDIALEINAGGLRNKIHQFSPDGELIKLYKQCGGKLLTLGADAHFPEHVASGIPEAISLLKEIGFDCFYYYKNRKPVAIPII